MGYLQSSDYSASLYGCALKRFVVTDYESAYIISDTVVYYFAGSLVHVIIDFVITGSCNRLLSVRRFFTIVLLILYRLQRAFSLLNH